MQTTPDSDELFGDLLTRATIVLELDGPQIEAWVSGLFPALDDPDTIVRFLDHCEADRSPVGATVAHAIGELTQGVDDRVSNHARAASDPDLVTEATAQVGASILTGAWAVEAPFGRSIVLGFDVPAVLDVPAAPAVPRHGVDADDEPMDLRHAILIEIDADGALEDLQLAGSPDDLIAEAAESPESVSATVLELPDALDKVIAAWPGEPLAAGAVGSGVVANEQFVRRRVFVAAGHLLPALRVAEAVFDVRRGLNDDDFAAANRAALSTLRAAVGTPSPASDPGATTPESAAWRDVIRGDGGELSGRERDGLLWLEWADWLGVGIGLLRAGAGSAVSGEAWVDLVNRCPEVSSTIAKGDREYAAWAFDVAIELLGDAAVIDDDGTLTEAGHAQLHAGMLAAWGEQ